REVTEVVLAQRGDDVEPARQLATAVHHAGAPADHDVADPVALKRLKERVRVEAGSLAQPSPKPSRRAVTRCCGAWTRLVSISESSWRSSSRSAISSLSTNQQASTTACRFSKLGCCPPVSQRATWARSRPIR